MNTRFELESDEVQDALAQAFEAFEQTFCEALGFEGLGSQELMGFHEFSRRFLFADGGELSLTAHHFTSPEGEQE